ncbi:MAG: zinc ribbon domain-containing protein [Lachnospiraceae bacterium]|nr:zinc ribbon domain-containing protein [Lachnospiraceae bacterium]MBR6357544.1 zinc ribbon domain-containing protein [Lachnospiraceae bacterium]MBR7076668.1 zinc ribbon domain-containing protein [Lachnospiraceae bacterium]
MKCTACGADLVDGAKFCEYCGTPVVATAPAPAAAPTQPAQEQNYTYQQPQNQAPQQPVRAQAQYVQPGAAPQQAMTPKCKTFGIISFVLGLWSTSFSWLGVLPAAGIGLGFFMVASAVVGLIFSGISRKEGNFKLARLGKVFSIIGLVLSAIFWIVGIIITASGSYRYY